MDMPRRISKNAREYGKQFRSIFDGHDTEENRLATARAIVAGTNSQSFLELVVGHMRSVSYSPQYKAYINSKFREAYLDMTGQIDNGDPDAPASWDAVLDRLEEYVNSLQEENWMSREDIEKTVLFGELYRMLKAVSEAPEKGKAIGAPGTVVGIVNSENFLTNKRGMQILPDSLYDYTACMVDDQWSIVHNVRQIYAQNFRDSLINTMNEVATRS